VVDPVSPKVAPDIAALVTAAEITARIPPDVLALDGWVSEEVPTLDLGHEQLFAPDGTDVDMLTAEGTLLASREWLREFTGAVRADVMGVGHETSFHRELKLNISYDNIFLDTAYHMIYITFK